MMPPAGCGLCRQACNPAPGAVVPAHARGQSLRTSDSRVPVRWHRILPARSRLLWSHSETTQASRACPSALKREPTAGGRGVTLVLIGLVGGVITGLSPCVLPVLPVVFLGGGSAAAAAGSRPAGA